MSTSTITISKSIPSIQARVVDPGFFIASCGHFFDRMGYFAHRDWHTVSFLAV
jgi:hypothetical protein